MLAYEEKNRKIGMTTSIIIHLLLLIFFLLYKAWPFDPPLAPQIGIEVNFGTSDVGSGDVQNTSEAGENTQENTETSESTEQNETTPETSSESTPVEEAVEAVESNLESYQEATTQPSTTPTTVTETKQTTTTTQQQTVNTQNLMNSSSSNNNNGDDENQVGDKGVEDGDVDAKNMMGNHGGGNGANLNMSGWKWDKLPNKKDPSSETGKITFRITIDEDGLIENVQIVSSTVSVPVANFYRDLLYKEATLKKDANFRGTSSTTGTVEWYIRSK